MGLLDAIRGSMRPPVPEEDETATAPGATHAGPSGEGVNDMNEQEHQAALATARAEGKAEGVKEGASAERTRIGAIVATEGIAGKAGLIGAAVAMAGDFPEASAETIAKHTLAAAGAQPQAPAPQASPASLAERLKAEQAAGGEATLPITGGDGGSKKKSGLLALAQARFPKKEG